MDLCHFGLPDWLENFQNPETPQALADYARAFAQRYDWVRFYTPVNEMYVCAKLSALLGLWNEQAQDERAFVTAVRHLAKANVLMMRAIATERPDAIFVNSESGEFFQSCCPDPNLCKIADFENQRRFLALDLLYAHPVREDMLDYLFEHGMPPEEYAWFMRQDVGKRAILGVDYYEWNEKLVDSEGHVQALGELFGWHVIVEQYYRRYQRPMMHTETNCLDAREAPRWLWRQWHNVQLMRRSGVPDRRLHLVLAHRPGGLGHRASRASRQRQSGWAFRSQSRSSSRRPGLSLSHQPFLCRRCATRLQSKRS